MADITQETPGAFGEGVQFGTTVGVTYGRLRSIIGDDTDLQGPDMTVEFAFRLSSGGANDTAWNLSYSNSLLTQWAWKLGILLTGGDVFLLFSTNLSGTDEAADNTGGDELIADTDWHHCAVTYETGGDIVLYYDGVEQARTAAVRSDLALDEDGGNQLVCEPFYLVGSAIVRIDNIRFNNAVDDAADILDRATNGLPGD